MKNIIFTLLLTSILSAGTYGLEARSIFDAKVIFAPTLEGKGISITEHKENSKINGIAGIKDNKIYLFIDLIGFPESDEAVLSMNLPYKNGKKYHEEGKHRLAVLELEKVPEYDPAYYDAQFMLAESHYALGHVAKAIEILSAIKDKDPDHEIIAGISMGLIYHTMKKYDESIDAFSKSVGIVDYVAAEWIKTLPELADIRQELLNSMIVADARLAEWYPTIAEMYYDKGEYAKANRELIKALTYYSYAPKMHIMLGNSYEKLKLYAEAAEAYERGYRFCPGEKEFPFYISRSYAMQNNKEKSLKWLKSAIELDKEYIAKVKTDDSFRSLADDPQFIFLTK